MLEKKELVAWWQHEIPVTLRVLKAMPEEGKDVRPHEKIKNSVELATLFGREAELIIKKMDGTLEMKDFMESPKFNSMAEAVSYTEEQSNALLKKLEETTEEQYDQMVDNWGTQARLIDAIMDWFKDYIHHRGQFSIYIRLAGAKLPQIYGPTADEPMSF
jgi:uncharacterized damage-inducible protein DinB